MVGKHGLEPRLPGPKPGALTLTLHPVNPFLFPVKGREGRSSLASRSDWPLGRHANLLWQVEETRFELVAFRLRAGRSTD